MSRAGSDTTLARVIKLVEEAKERRAPVERQADRYAKFFLPALLLAGGLTYYFTGNWLRTVAVLIVACPCALILATPTAMVAAIGGLARRGILVRGGNVLQQAAQVDTVVFDKTGTVTEGRFEIVRILPLDGDEDALLALAAAAERGSDHMLARVIVEEAARRGLTVAEPEDARVLPGRGVEAQLGRRHGARRQRRVPGRARHAATPSRCSKRPTGSAPRAVLVAEGDRLAGAILLRDRVREGIKEAVAQLQAMDITHQVMLTGDRRRAAEVIAREIGIPNVEAELLPEQKLDRVRQLSSQGRKVAMVGDGINDAPALAAADVGIAVAGASDITAEAADVVYLPHSLDKLPRFFDVSRRAVQTAWQNIIIFAGIVNFTAVILVRHGQDRAHRRGLHAPDLVVLRDDELAAAAAGGTGAQGARRTKLLARARRPGVGARARDGRLASTRRPRFNRVLARLAAARQARAAARARCWWCSTASTRCARTSWA